ncbi:MAG: glycoside hydrolase family 3 N-terminal domain-containing protein [Gemmatimonadaceae bacterium]
MPAAAQGPAYRDARLPVAQRVADLISRMSVEEKFWQLFMLPDDLSNPSHDYSHGAFGLQVPPPSATTDSAAARLDAARINDIQRYFVERTRLGIPIIPFEEAVHGLVRPGATMFPQAIGLAATWDTALVARVATAMAAETRSRGIRQVLSPVLNIASDPRWGRVEETYGEDPWLVSRIGQAFIRPFEMAGIVTTPKHFIANVGDGGRDSYPVALSERRLDEEYFPPFKAAAQGAGARAIMSAYNSVDGLAATQNAWLLTTKLKREWGFGGIVISDAAATGGATVLHMTEASTATAAKRAIEAGLDVIFQTSWEQHRPYLAAFQHGDIDAAAIDSAVSRVLRAKFELGLFESPYVNPDQAARVSSDASHRALSLEAAQRSIVLLQNQSAVLPISARIPSVALIGVDAAIPRMGGYSAVPSHTVSIRDAFVRRLGASRVHYAPGPGRSAEEYVTVPSTQLSPSDSGRAVVGLRGEYFDNPDLHGEPKVVRVDAQVAFSWTLTGPTPEVAADWFSARWSGRLTAPRSGVRFLGLTGNDGYRLWIDGRLRIDHWRKVSFGTHVVPVSFAAGTHHDIRLEYHERTGNTKLQLIWDAGAPRDGDSRIAEAVAAARRSAVAIVVVGLEEGEFRDRSSLRLPGQQEALIRQVAATKTPTIVVLVGGSAVTMEAWRRDVGAIVDSWYAGPEGGTAVADVLFGNIDAAGRLPLTFPISEGQLPLVYNHLPTGRGDDYVDLTGRPLFPFGYGLSYTTFEYTDLQVAPGDIRAGVPTRVTCRVRNTGSRAGDDVVQLYVRDLLASLARPVMQLAAFQHVHLAPGESMELTFALSGDQLQMRDANMQWVVEPGTFRVLIGASSQDIRLRGTLEVR